MFQILFIIKKKGKLFLIVIHLGILVFFILRVMWAIIGNRQLLMELCHSYNIKKKLWIFMASTYKTLYMVSVVLLFTGFFLPHFLASFLPSFFLFYFIFFLSYRTTRKKKATEKKKLLIRLPTRHNMIDEMDHRKWLMLKKLNVNILLMCGLIKNFMKYANK